MYGDDGLIGYVTDVEYLSDYLDDDGNLIVEGNEEELLESLIPVYRDYSVDDGYEIAQAYAENEYESEPSETEYTLMVFSKDYEFLGKFEVTQEVEVTHHAGEIGEQANKGGRLVED